MSDELLNKAADAVLGSVHAVVFSGAGISVESGIPPFRGQGGLWSKYDPSFIEINNFYKHPKECWIQIKKIFYDFMGTAKPNAAHLAVAELEKRGYVKEVITQNIDNLHQDAGSRTVYEFHGNTKRLICTKCGKDYFIEDVNLENMPPCCSSCGGLLKPDFIFFGEGIPQDAYQNSFRAAESCDLMLIIGTTGEVMPASMLPTTAKRHGATIIEINPESSNYTNDTTDIFLKGKAGSMMSKLAEKVINNS